jgi:hypothetical protein
MPSDVVYLAVGQRIRRRGQAGQLAIAERLTVGSSLSGAIVSGIMYGRAELRFHRSAQTGSRLRDRPMSMPSTSKPAVSVDADPEDRDQHDVPVLADLHASGIEPVTLDRPGEERFHLVVDLDT